eukprot:Amastigsp_a676485_15.p3 type:complete len:115 gc:universal Amastigsp_a676485_15:1-345(+)
MTLVGMSLKNPAGVRLKRARVQSLPARAVDPAAKSLRARLRGHDLKARVARRSFETQASSTAPAARRLPSARPGRTDEPSKRARRRRTHAHDRPSTRQSFEARPSEVRRTPRSV